MIDRNFIGHTMPVHESLVEAGRLRFFAKAIGETNPIYTDEDAARAAGYRSLPIAPTMTFCLEMDVPDPFEMFKMLDVDLGRLLHAEQSFTYHDPVCAGDTVTFESTITDIFDKKDGALEFVVVDTKITNQDDAHVADARRVLVIRN